MNTTTTKGLDLSAIENSWGFKGKNYLFTIGIDQYEHWKPLKCAVKDIQDFANILTDYYQFKEKNVIILKDKEATEKNIFIKFKELIQKITDQDNLVIYFSGHGHYDEVTEIGYWVPVNAHAGGEYGYEFIDTGTIVSLLKRINSLHTFLIVDACFSGTLITQIKSTPRSERYKSRRVFTSGRKEVVNDGPEGGNSPFAKGLLTYLKKNNDKYISASELIVDVREYVESNSQQTPMAGRIANTDDEGGEFVFHLKMSEAEIWAGTNKQHTREGYQKFIEQFPESEHREEAREACDWLTAKEASTIQSLQVFLNKYKPDGTYIPQANKILKTLEEERDWKKAKRMDTFSAYIAYLSRYPRGKYKEEANRKTEQMAKDQDDQAYKKAIEENSAEALEAYIEKSADKKYKVQAEKKLSQKTSSVEEPEVPDEEKAWKKADEAGTYIAYLDFTRAYPESRFVEQTEQKMKILDDRALNQIRLTEQNRTLSLQRKIEECLKYFNTFPGAENNKEVKQIKDRLQIQKYSHGYNR